jgi:hypothetical protein
LEAITELNRLRHEQAAAISNLTLEVKRLREEQQKPAPVLPQPQQWNPWIVPVPQQPFPQPWNLTNLIFPTGFSFNGQFDDDDTAPQTGSEAQGRKVEK